MSHQICVVLWWLGRLCVYDGLYDEIETIKIPEEHLVLPGSGAVLSTGLLSATEVNISNTQKSRPSPQEMLIKC